MSRDPRKLQAFQLADALVVRVYDATRDFPPEERYGIQNQIRRAAVSIVCNVVEGCARRTTREYLHFINIALASASETRYLLGLAMRLGMTKSADLRAVYDAYGDLLKVLQKLTHAIEQMEA